MNKEEKSLSEKISELIDPNPVWKDPESDFSDTTAKLNSNDEFLEDAVISQRSFLSKNVLLDEEDIKYVGKKVSRRSYEKGSLNPSTLTANVDSCSGDESSVSESSSAASEGSEECESEELDAESCDESENGPFKRLSNFSIEMEKANAVRSQIRLWDSLLEIRIQLQKCLVASNKLPPHNSFDSFKGSAGREFETQLALSQQEGLSLLSKLMDLQRMLFYVNSETRSISSGKSKKEDGVENGNEICNVTQDMNENHNVLKKKRKLSDISKEIHDQDINFKRFRNDTLQKWYLRSKAVTVKSSNFSAFDLSILKQIEHVLRDKESLIKRTQKRRSSYHIFGVSPLMQAKEVGVNEEFDCDIYDDDDFYHKLLRELIERKSADMADPTQLGRQWSELQKLRKKLKKKVDTKASKGRKLRYVVHSKLVNFMAPVPYSWNDTAMDDIFRSLFGNVE